MMKKLVMMVLLACTDAAMADISVTSVTAQQRYPWNGLVDIVVTIQGASNEVAQTECTFVATNNATQAAVTIATVSQNGADELAENTCTRHYLWNSTNDVGAVKIDDLALTVNVMESLGGVQLWADGPYWAECNVGASQPEEYGYYFWWGDTVGYERNAANNGWVSVKDGSSFSFLSGNCPTYGKVNSTLESLGYIDSTGNLVAAHDAATAHLGAPWRMPTDAEFSALISNCTTTWTTRNRVYGRLVRGKGDYASKSIFLPAAGYGIDSGLGGTGSYGCYWFSTPDSGNSDIARYLVFKSSDFNQGSYGYRYYGQSVRPLRGFARGATVNLALDCRTGTRTTGKAETITYSTKCETSDTNAISVVAVNGTTLSERSGSGTVIWVPTRNGTYTLTHTVLTNGVQVGETLTATFVAEGFNPATPVISPESGTTFETSLTVSMTCASEDATIHYTTDGTTPTMDSPTYKKFRIYGKTTVKAIAFYEDGTASEMAVAEYALGTCEDPVISLKDGTVFQHSDQVVSISCGEEGVLRYTLDGTEPTAESPAYTGPFTISESTVVKAKVFSDSYFDSQVVTANLTREWVQVETPVVSAAESFTGSKTKVTISCGTDGALIRYTTNGNDPNSHSSKYTGPFYVTESCTVKAYAVLSDWTNSEIGSAAITKVWGIGDTLGKPDHTFATSGDAGFTKVTDVTATLGESMRSGAISDNQKSILSTTIMGPGTLTFKWKTSCEADELHEWDHAEFAVDGTVVTNMDGVTGWVAMSYHIAGEGEHTVTWTYVKDDVESAEEDCLWVSDYAWVTELTHTETTEVPVPYGWLLAKCRGAVDEYQIYENVAKETAANGINTVENCYVAGLDPESATNTFNSVITMDAAGLPQITWDPDLGDARTYKTLGAKTVNGEWDDITDVSDADRKAAGYQFFKVSVEMK